MDVYTFNSRPKRVTEPLSAAERARLLTTHSSSDSSSSGSQYEAATCLSHLIQSFLETDESNPDQDSVRDESDTETDSHNIGYYSDRTAEIKSLLDPMHQIDPFRTRLKSDVQKAIEFEKTAQCDKPSLFNRAVSSQLSKMGYNSGVCKSSWKASNGLPAGSYEYIDVVVNTNNERYIIDPDFGSGVQLARATNEYERFLTAVPDLVVAKVEAVGRAVRIVAELARRDLRIRGMHVPPWRKTRYVVAKWLGPYKRTGTGTVRELVPVPVRSEVVCRTGRVIGFQVVQTGKIR